MKNYCIEVINGDNRRPGMRYEEGFLVRYRPHASYGWLCCRTLPNLEEAEAFAATLNEKGDLP